jgi:Domain of unknown function (DUF6378)
MNVQTMIDSGYPVDGDHPGLSPVVQEMIGIRQSVLKTAGELIDGDRARDYGDATKMHARIAAGWELILGVKITAEQAALCMTWLKMARIIENPDHMDSYIDAVAYLALSAEARKKNSAQAG